MSDSLEPEDYPIGFSGSPDNLLRLYLTEMSRLGVLSTFWVSTDDALCHLFEELGTTPKLAHAAFYSVESARGRRGMVLAVAKASTLTEEHIAYIEHAIKAHSDATEKRNKILHGLLQVNPDSGDIAIYSHKPATKTPLRIADDVSGHIRTAIMSCYHAHALLSLTRYLVDLVTRTEKDTQRIQRIEHLLSEMQTRGSP